MWTVSRRIAAPAEDVWRLLVDPEVWPRWGPTVVAAEIDGGFLRHGATGHGVEPDGAGCRAWMSAPLWAPAYLPVLQIALRRIDEMAVQSGAGGQ